MVKKTKSSQEGTCQQKLLVMFRNNIPSKDTNNMLYLRSITKNNLRVKTWTNSILIRWKHMRYVGANK